MRSIGAPVASRIARAASSEITSPNGRMLCAGAIAHRESSRTRCPSSGSSSLVIAEPDGIFRSRQRDDDLSLRGAGARAAQHRGRPDLLIAQHAEELAEPVEPFLEQIADDLVGRVARRDAGAAGRDDDLRGRLRRAAACMRRANRVGIVAHDRAPGDVVAVRLEQLRDGEAARVGSRACACR